MKCELIFYMANKTAENEDTLKNCIKPLNIKLEKTTMATNPKSLEITLSKTVKQSNLIFIVGGLEKKEDLNIETVLSNIFNYKNTSILDNSIVIQNKMNLSEGYIIESGTQTIILLPDNPSDIENMLSYPTLKFLSSKYSIDLQNIAKPDIQIDCESICDCKYTTQDDTDDVDNSVEAICNNIDKALYDRDFLELDSDEDLEPNEDSKDVHKSKFSIIFDIILLLISILTLGTGAMILLWNSIFN